MEYKLDHQHHLLRLNFAPQHIIDGKVIPAAISTEDLQHRGYSLDSENLLSIETLTERAESQSAKNPEERKSPHISRFLCGEAASIKHDDIQAFNIFHSPVCEDNEKNIKANFAHVSLLCTDTTQGRSYYKKAKNLLLPVLQNLIALEDYIQQKKQLTKAHETTQDQ
ncbi:hypothetical protein JFU48_27725 [Pseudomonas sp. TH49]|uniref:hypothetical protein n=1 Tax=Pseudomonas sp. TH49 TaxID=2796413 RepID=UPI0019143A8B|nr:hypothetical protein [Pseudomonas sp. TH49]MBK5345132.1 hypothetical protein [Pseudomonas sp. TH49]